MKTFELGGERFSVKFFKEHTMKECVKMLPNIKSDRVINAWKQINEKSVRTKKKEDVPDEKEVQD